MKRNEAIELGYHYTGMSCDSWDSKKWEEYKTRAAHIKNQYKGADYRVVTERLQGRYGVSIWKNIYGNDIFQKVMYFNQENAKEYLNKHEERLNEIKAKYEAEIQKENENYQKHLDDYNEIIGFMKN